MSFIVWVPGPIGTEWGVVAPIGLPSIVISAPAGLEVPERNPSIAGTAGSVKIETVGLTRSNSILCRV